jgi:23S rRNA pseudouridine2605 synthase
MSGALVKLQKVLTDSGVASRRHADALIAADRVTVDGRTETAPFARIPADADVRLDGKPLPRKPSTCCFLCDKPRGVLCTARDPEGRETIGEWAVRHGAPRGVRLYTVGRLDFMSEGLVLLTNDGELAEKAGHPRYGIRKTYRVLLPRLLSESERARLVRGIPDGGETLRALSAENEYEAGKGFVARIVLGEGRNREIRRMMEALGLRVRALRRVAIGPLGEDLLRGKPLYRLTKADIARLLSRE